MKIKKLLALLAVLAIVVGIFAMPAAASIDAVTCPRCGSNDTYYASNATYYYGTITGQYQGQCSVCHSTTYSAPRYRGGYVCSPCGNRYGGTSDGYGYYCYTCKTYR